jgi:hypothetical protein
MLNDHSLGDRLNAVKNGKPIPEPPMQPQTVMNFQQPQPSQKPSLKNFLISKAISTVDVFAASFLYGYALKTVFGMDWNLLGALAVGFLINHAVTIWPKIIKGFFKK